MSEIEIISPYIKIYPNTINILQLFFSSQFESLSNFYLLQHKTYRWLKIFVKNKKLFQFVLKFILHRIVRHKDSSILYLKMCARYMKMTNFGMYPRRHRSIFLPPILRETLLISCSTHRHPSPPELSIRYAE